jgi:hypothetical protein
MPLDDGRMTETCYGNNIRRGEEEILRLRTINCWINATGSLIFGTLTGDMRGLSFIFAAGHGQRSHIYRLWIPETTLLHGFQ